MKLLQGNRQTWLGLLVSVAALVAVFAVTDVRAMVAALSNLSAGVLLGALALFVLSIGLRALAWRVLLGGRVAWWSAFLALNVGYLVNNVIPLRAGEAARAVLIAPKARVPFWHAVSTVMVERLLDVVLLAAMLVGSLPWVLDLPQARQASQAFGGVALLALVGLVLLARWRRAVGGFLEARVAPRLGKRLRRFVGWALHFLDGLEALARPFSFLAVLGLMVLSWAVQVLAYGMTLRALVPQANLWWAAFALGSVGMGVAVPSAPGGLGVMEGVLVFVLSALGVAPSLALAYALAMHAIYYLITISLGVVGVQVYGTSLSSLLARAKGQETPDPAEV